jgi:putative transposase
MPRPRRLNIAGIPQHITQRGNNRQVCFFCDEDRFTYLDILRRSARRRRCDIHAYVLMTSSLVHSADYCLTCYRYIELNPVRAGMVPSPAEYFWSSHRCNAMGWENDLITPQEEWLSLGQSKDARCAAYRALFEQAPNDERLAQIRYCNRKGLPLGDPSFKVQIESHLRVRLGNGKVGRPRKPD